ncbi:nucleotide sugar dehydrogenase [Floridanema aerugineum]|uniref:UDP-glucose 6-dehydrogenase n=1 Tax=Floridaenema aerugineum BLCC-F46 TaxID=3153654 RepID=A0ABV4XGK3_9CYAN
MRILVWGLGYVGTVVSACFAEMGHEVIGVETNSEKVKAFNEGRSPIVEPELDDLIASGIKKGNLKAVNSGKQYVPWADVSLICVGTPSAPDGSPVMTYIESAAREIGEGLRNSDRYHVVVLRSTVFPGVSRNLLTKIVEKYSRRKAGEDFGVAINPEFLRETTAVRDFYEPPYTVIGELDPASGDFVAALYQSIKAPIYHVGLEEAELLKVINNSFHALKVGFANEIGRIGDALGLDSNAIMQLVCADYKLNISPKYLMPGFAFGGSCLPKDLRSLAYNARRLGVEVPIVDSILPSNTLHIEAARIKVHEMQAKKIAILGLSFKGGTDDLRESPIIALIRDLWRDGVPMMVYDPDVQIDKMLGSNLEYLERQLPQIHQLVSSDLNQVLTECDGIVLSKQHPVFSAAMSSLYGQMPVLDLSRWELYSRVAIEESVLSQVAA